jgi:hypothetical protein
LDVRVMLAFPSACAHGMLGMRGCVI